MKRFKFRIMALLFMLVPLVCEAAIIKIGFSGVVDSVSDTYNLLENGVQAGDSITGYYIYNSETIDSEPEGLTSIGWYRQTAVPSAMCLTLDSLIFQSDSTNVDIMIGVSNNYGGATLDCYGVDSNNNLVLDNGVFVDNLHWRLDDNSGTALSNDSLPLVPFDLSQWQSNLLRISGSGYPTPPIEGDKLVPFSIYGHVTFTYLIPEPATILLFSLGGLFLRRRS